MVGIEISPLGAAVASGMAAGANGTAAVVGVVAIGEIIIMVVGKVALLGLDIVGAAFGGTIVIFVALLVTGVVNVGTGAEGELVAVVVSIHVIMEVMVVQIRFNHIVAVVVGAVISTIDMETFGEVQQLKSGSRAVADALKIFWVLLV